MTKEVLDEYTTAEQAKLREFRQIVSDLLITDEHKEDAFLIRWLRARNLDLKKAEDMLRKDFEWRKINNVDGILEREDTPKELQNEIPIAWCGTDSEGSPILLIPAGKHDSRKALETYGKDAMGRFNIINMEKIKNMLHNESKKQGRKLTQIVEIMDLEGYSYRQISSKLCREFMIETQKTVDAHYPELLKYAIIINAPKVFAILFQVLKPFVPKHTLEKIDIYGGDKEKWMKAIAEKFPQNQIPPHWGGTMEGKDAYCSGSAIWFQGPADMHAFMNGLNESDAEYSVATINARNKFTKEFDISEKDAIMEWKFKTESNDIGFQISFCSTKNGNVTQDILPYTRVDAHNSVQEGSHICDTPGKYTFTFDNSFSLVKSKTLLYKIDVMDPDSDFQECPEF